MNFEAGDAVDGFFRREHAVGFHDDIGEGSSIAADGTPHTLSEITDFVCEDRNIGGAADGAVEERIVFAGRGGGGIEAITEGAADGFDFEVSEARVEGQLTDEIGSYIGGEVAFTHDAGAGCSQSG